MKKILSVFLVFVFLFGLCSCVKKPDPADRYTVRVVALKGPTGMGLATLMSEDEQEKTKNDYSFLLCSEPTEVAAQVLRGDFDVAAVPVNLAASLFNKGADISLLAVNTLGVLYLLENGTEIQSIGDLRGKTVYATNPGATPEYILNFVLKKNGLTPGADVTVEFMADASELATRLAAGNATVGMLPEPSVSAALQSGSRTLRVALDMTAEWNKVCETELAQGCLVVSNSFRTEHPEAFRTLSEEMKTSVDAVNRDVTAASELIAKYGIVPNAKIAEKALPNCHICFLDGERAADIMKNMLRVLWEANPASVGGKLPDDSFYG